MYRRHTPPLMSSLRSWLKEHPVVWRVRRPLATITRSPLLLALQGGGAHGAFTWGVLDALLEDPTVPIAAASGASAGALNAVLLAQGLAEGGADPWHGGSATRLEPEARAAARRVLERFWMAVARSSPFETHAAWLLLGDPDTPRLSPWGRWMLDWTALFTPRQLNPLDINPLRDLLKAHVDMRHLRRACPLPLFIAATRVRTAEPRIFREHELSTEVLLASTCLPRLHHTVEIDGEPYWDGGYSANPPILPLITDGPASANGERQLLLVTLNPKRVDGIPDGTKPVLQRQLELAFSGPLATELRWLERLRAEARQSPRPLLPWTLSPMQRQWLGVNLHRIGIDDVPRSASPPTASGSDTEGKLIANVAHLQALRDAGRAAAAAWRRGCEHEAPGTVGFPE
jgi:NTE family protein